MTFHSNFGFPGPFLLIAAVVVIGIAAAIYGAVAARKRREALFELAQRLNLNFNPGHDYALADQYGFLKKLAQGDNRYGYNILSGKYRDYDVLAFDYHYQVTTHDKNGSHTTHYT
ncbi:MAG TPA: hypothetical protein VFV81_00035, partial [Verrucomicrobiae bacterium]|nr:hypothetical protein [Verrucomicrobiae bacterium]